MMQIRPIEMTQYEEALAASEVQSVAVRYAQGYQEQLARIEQAKKEKRLLPDPKDEDPVAIPWGAFLEGQLIACVTAIEFTMRYEGKDVRMCGIGGVATRPEYRRRGAIRKIMAAIFTDCLKRGDVFSYLYPFSFAYYHRFGYDFGCRRLHAKIPLRDFSHFPPTGTVRQAQKKDRAAIEQIYAGFIADTNGAVTQRGERWQDLCDHDPYLKQRFTYIWSDEQGRDRAYAVTERKEDPKNPLPGQDWLQVLDWAALDATALRGLLGFLGRFPTSQYQFVAMRLPLHVPLETLFLEVDTIERNLETAGQVRILDVKAALAGLRLPSWLAPFSFSLAVTDAFLPQNSGIYRIDMEPLSNQVSFAAATSAENVAADLKLGVEPLASLVLGSRDLSELLSIGAVEVSSELEADRLQKLQALFRIRPACIYDYF